jgi:hypothetical protein
MVNPPGTGQDAQNSVYGQFLGNGHAPGRASADQDTTQAEDHRKDKPME